MNIQLPGWVGMAVRRVVGALEERGSVAVLVATIPPLALNANPVYVPASKCTE